jgi:carbamoyltransferase
MNILGIQIGHDSSAALVIDGRIVADVAEERFTRVKHYSDLPMQAVDYCLKSQGLTMADIDAVAVPTKHPMPDLNFLLNLTGAKEEKPSRKRQLFEFVREKMQRPAVKAPLYIKNFPIHRRTEVLHIEHHLAHAASAYYTSGSPEKQLIVTIDGSGDGLSGALWRGENGKITKLHGFPNAGSLGWFYSNVTEGLGWWHGDGEGKTMGLAPYGDYSKCQGVLDKFVPKYANGELIEPHDFGRIYYWNIAGAIQWHFDESYEIEALIKKHGRENIAAEGQRVLEEQVRNIVFPWMERENTKNLSAAGGVMLNVKLNQRLWESGRIAKHHTYANPGDSGLAVGAALCAYYQANPSAPFHRVEDVYWGPQYSAAEIESILKARNLTYRRVDNIEEFTAKQLAQDKIVAWFQGRMESGPRALGNRSILMSANRAENKDIINARVKFREAFRPFCPSMLWEKRNEYLQNVRDEFFMITSFTAQKDKWDKVPAVVHADKTLRPQTVNQTFNRRFWNLINEFGKQTNEYLLLNTSFNIMGEPIVCNPREAIRCLYDTGLDMLVMDNFVLEKHS